MNLYDQWRYFQALSQGVQSDAHVGPDTLHDLELQQHDHIEWGMVVQEYVQWWLPQHDNYVSNTVRMDDME